MKVYYIDPQSYNNLAVYDKSLLENIDNCDIIYYHNVKYQCVKIPNVKYKGLYNYSDKRSLWKAISYIASTIHVCKSCILDRPDIVHIQWFRLWIIDCMLLRILSLLNIKIVYTAHNVLPHNPKRYDRRHFSWYYNHVDSIIVHTQRTKEEIIQEFNVSPSKIHIVMHGMLSVFVDSDAVNSRTKEICETLGSKGKIVFASMGFQNLYKGVDLISEVWRSTPQLNSNQKCMLLIVGKIQNANLDSLLEFENVHIIDDVVSDIDFEAYLRIASVALLPYRKISQSGFLLTTLQRNIPVIVSDIGGLTDPLQYAHVGWNIGNPSVKTLKDAMIDLVFNPDKLQRVRDDRASFEKVKSIYSWANIGKKTRALYEEIRC